MSAVAPGRSGARGDIPVSWACGVTPRAAVLASHVPFAVMPAPGHAFVTDAPDPAHHA